MEEFKKILILENEIEAQLLDSVLNERGIPHRIRSYHDSAYDGIYQAQKGWGAGRGPPELSRGDNLYLPGLAGEESASFPK